MGNGSVVWAESPGDDADEADIQAHGDVDATFAERRLRRWLKGMFGGPVRPQDEADEQEPDRDA